MDKQKLLIVDADIMARQLILSVAKDMGFEVEEANNGAEGTEIVKKGASFDVIIADLRMGGTGGLEFLKALKGCSPYPAVILVTTYGSVLNAKEALAGNTFEYLTKPLDMVSVEKAIGSAIRQKQLVEGYQEYLTKIPKVLVIEDNESYRKTLDSAIREMGFDVVSVPNDMEGLQLFNQNHFEIVISDIKKPEADGIDLISDIKEVDADAIIILISGYADLNIVVQTIKKGAYDFISKPFDPEHLKIIVQNAWEKKRRIYQEKMLTHLYKEVKKDAFTDLLTGLRNDYYANMRLEEELDRVKRGDYNTFAVVKGDVDNFKIINDKAGRHVGDVILHLIGRTIKDIVRVTDTASRYEADEFLLILPGTDCYGAEGMVKKLLKKIKEINYQGHPKLKDLPVEITMSFGISCLGCAGTESTELMAKADYALYECKVWHEEQCVTYERLLREKPYKEGIVEMNETFEKEISNRIAYSLANLIDHKDLRTRNHSRLVSSLSVKLGRYLSLDEETLNRIQMGGMLHDVGKLGMSLEILNKRDKLTEDELAIMKKHVEIGIKIVSNISNLEKVVPVIAAIHERWDGKGYPYGLKGEEIPIEARIIAVVDTYLAMRIDRAYRKGIADNAAIEELTACSGKQFDPRIVDAFLQIQKNR